MVLLHRCHRSPADAAILHDLKRVRDGYEDNYISATLGVYLSLYNVFQSLLALLGLTSGSNE